MSLALTVQGSNGGVLGLLLDETPLSLVMADQVDGMADDDGPGSVLIEVDELDETGGGVLLQGGGTMYDLLQLSQKEIKSAPSSIAPFNLIPYLNGHEQLNQYENVQDAHLWQHH